MAAEGIIRNFQIQPVSGPCYAIIHNCYVYYGHSFLLAFILCCPHMFETFYKETDTPYLGHCQPVHHSYMLQALAIFGANWCTHIWF